MVDDTAAPVGHNVVPPVVVAAVAATPVVPAAPVIPGADATAGFLPEPDDFNSWLVIFERTSRGVYPFNQALFDAVRHDRVRHTRLSSKVQAEITYRRFSLHGGRKPETDSSDSPDVDTEGEIEVEVELESECSDALTPALLYCAASAV